MFTQKFRSHVCIFDAIECEVDGVTYCATLRYDDATHPNEFECYDAKQIADFEIGDWFFCGLIISAHVNETLIADDLASVWGIEANLTNNNDHLTGFANDFLSDAIAETKPKIIELSNRMNALTAMVAQTA